MSYFGDDTAKQDMLGWIEMEMKEHNLSCSDIIACLADIIKYIAEEINYEETNYDGRNKQNN